ncbi:MAG: 2-amino-4-hydroxy-6-hydroxymethyldihydropteridine diphosphokinase [Bacteroidales bacterium]
MMDKELESVFLSLGSNQGNRMEYIINAIQQLRPLSEKPLRVSGIYETEPWGFTAPQSFYNLAAELKTKLTPGDFIMKILAIEATLGRKRTEDPGYQSRPIDIDILFFGEKIILSPELTVPHPQLHMRRFVLEPLAELAPLFVHPLIGKTVIELLDRCQDEGKVIYLSPFPRNGDIV